MVGIASMDGLLNALTKAIYSDHMRSYGLGISLVLGPRPAHAMGQHLLHVHRPAGVLLLLVPAHMLACNQIRCKNMRTYWDQTFFKCKPSLNMLSLCVACDAPTSPCACIASAASRCGHCKQQSHTKMIQHVEMGLKWDMDWHGRNMWELPAWTAFSMLWQ